MFIANAKRKGGIPVDKNPPKIKAYTGPTVQTSFTRPKAHEAKMYCSLFTVLGLIELLR